MAGCAEAGTSSRGDAASDRPLRAPGTLDDEAVLRLLTVIDRELITCLQRLWARLLTWPTAGERRSGVSINDPDSPDHRPIGHGVGVRQGAALQTVTAER